MALLRLEFGKTSHLPRALQALDGAGFRVRRIPEGRRSPSNGPKIILKAGELDLRIRLFIYKVTGSGRERPKERRIEITSTYQKNLSRLRDFRDVVLGYDVEGDLFVGVDPRRIAHGGPTGNASSFFDGQGLLWNRSDEILVRPRPAALFPDGLEFHAFVHPARLAEYLFNLDAIHAGTYGGSGLFSKAGEEKLPDRPVEEQGDVIILEAVVPPVRRTPATAEQVRAFEQKGLDAFRKKVISPSTLRELQRVMEENGRLGEAFVLRHERKRLRRAGRADLAARIRWVSQESVSAGFDILSYEVTGEERLIEVKSTAGKSAVFFMSNSEWKTAVKESERYYIYRVTLVRQSQPELAVYRDPVALESQGVLTKTVDGWRVSLSPSS